MWTNHDSVTRFWGPMDSSGILSCVRMSWKKSWASKICKKQLAKIYFYWGGGRSRCRVTAGLWADSFTATLRLLAGSFSLPFLDCFSSIGEQGIWGGCPIRSSPGLTSHLKCPIKGLLSFVLGVNEELKMALSDWSPVLDLGSVFCTCILGLCDPPVTPTCPASPLCVSEKLLMPPCHSPEPPIVGVFCVPKSFCPWYLLVHRAVNNQEFFTEVSWGKLTRLLRRGPPQESLGPSGMCLGHQLRDDS